MLFRSFAPGRESTEVRLYSEAEVPWAALAFATIRQTLTLYFADRARGRFPLHTGDIIKQDQVYSFRPGPASAE